MKTQSPQTKPLKAQSGGPRAATDNSRPYGEVSIDKDKTADSFRGIFDDMFCYFGGEERFGIDEETTIREIKKEVRKIIDEFDFFSEIDRRELKKRLG